MKNGLMASNIVENIRLPKIAKQEMRVLTRDEERRLITAARMAPEPAAFAIIFDLFTGLRIGELCGLRWENVDLEHRCFKVCEIRTRLPNFDDSIKTSTSVATRCMEERMDVVTLARLLGHANPSITLDKYGHALSDHQRSSVEKLDGLYQPGPFSAPRVQPEQG